jgi:hypothetical protein
MEDTHETVLRWPFTDANDVIVTGDFDQWSKSTHLTKDATGFEAKVRIPWGTKVEYKFLVDGQWRARDDLPTEKDPSGKYLNNAYTAPPKPTSAVKSAIAYVASGLGGAIQNLTGVDPTGTQKAETSTKDVEAAAIPTPPEVPPPAVATATAAASKKPEPVVALAAPTSDKVVTPTISGLEASTHAPVVIRKPGSPEKTSQEGARSPPAPAPTAALPAIPAATAVDAKANTLADEPVVGAKSESPADKPVAANPKTDGKAAMEGKFSESHLTAGRASFSKKHHFPASQTDNGDASSSRLSSSIRKKRHSLFGRASEVDDGSSSYSHGKRKKKLSIIQKIRHFFHHKDHKD